MNRGKEIEIGERRQEVELENLEVEQIPQTEILCGRNINKLAGANLNETQQEDEVFRAKQGVLDEVDLDFRWRHKKLVTVRRWLAYSESQKQKRSKWWRATEQSPIDRQRDSDVTITNSDRATRIFTFGWQSVFSEYCRSNICGPIKLYYNTVASAYSTSNSDWSACFPQLNHCTLNIYGTTRSFPSKSLGFTSQQTTQLNYVMHRSNSTAIPASYYFQNLGACFWDASSANIRKSIICSVFSTLRSQKFCNTRCFW